MTVPAARALVLAAGRGTRLRPLTCDRAKAAMPVGGIPLIRHLLQRLRAHGVRDVVVNLHHLPQTITRIVGDGTDDDVRVRYSWEPALLGSAGGPRHALPLLAPRFFMVNGDTLTDVPLAALERHHERSGALVTLAVLPNTEPGRYGGVVADGRGWVTGFTRPGDERPSWHFVGVQVAERAAFAALPDDRPASTIPDLYLALIAARPAAIGICPAATTFHDIGTVADYHRTALALAARDAGRPGIPAGGSLDPSVTIERTILWDDVVVGASARLVECVVGDRVRIPAGAQFERCAIVRAGGRQTAPGETVVQGDLLVAPFE